MGGINIAIKELKEEYFVIMATVNHAIKKEKQINGFVPNKNPIYVATPLPPLNFNQIGKI